MTLSKSASSREKSREASLTSRKKGYAAESPIHHTELHSGQTGLSKRSRANSSHQSAEKSQS